MKLLSLIALTAPTLLANAIFQAPAGCTALAPAPGLTGVQCSGSFTGAQNTVALFSGTGSGSLFATSVLFEWDFTTFGVPARVVNIAASVNGRTDFRQDIISSASQRHAGSFTLPVTFGEALNTWQISLDTASTSLDIPSSGAGVRLLVSPVPEPATGAILALGLAAFAFRRRRQLPLLTLLLAPQLPAGAIFTAPSGCTALAPAPDVTGVQCFGSFAQPDPAQPLSAQFSGGGSGPLWATSATFDYDFFTSSLIIRAIGITASVNGSSNSTVFLATLGSQQHTGSLTIPLTFGETLNSWNFLVSLTTATSDGSRTIDIPTSGVGLRLLVNHAPPSTAVPEPAAGAILALGLAAFAFRRRRQLPLLTLLLAPQLPAGAIFTAPNGCTALAPAPDVTGVQCFGSFAQPDPAQPLSAQFSGGGSGPLWATSATFDYEFFTSSLAMRAIGITASINGSSNSTIVFGALGSQQHTGSLTIPLTFGETLNSWNFLVFFIANGIPDSSRTIDIPTSGVGLRLLVNHAPPSTAVPEPATAGLLALAGAALLLRRAKRLLLLPLVALVPLAAAPLFTAPAGCTAIQPVPSGEGVACYGNTGLVRGAPELSFAGGGAGPLWACHTRAA